jgi:preprotein translocase subunit SecA
MFDKLKGLFDFNRRELKKLTPLVVKINALDKEYSSLSDAKLKAKTAHFKKLLKEGQTLNDILPDAFATVREVIWRLLGEKAFDAQLTAALALHQGYIAEQRTGEGKTHSAVFSAYLNALLEKGVHIVTVNDYLARVGAGWYPVALEFLGLKVACIIHEQSYLLDSTYTDPLEKIDERLAHLRPITRKEAYQADVTYGTNNEFGFDYLRDNMARDLANTVQRGHHYAIVDEVDQVLIDEARTPLIISSPDNRPVENYQKYAALAGQLQPEDSVIDEKSRSATLSEFGIRKVEKLLGIKNLYEESYETIHYIENAIKAASLFKKDKDYVVKDNEVIIVDEFTGRLMHGRRWSDGLHQAVEAKEGVPVQQESRTHATITFQNYFRLYQKLAGMTGTAATESEEFRKIYNLEVLVVPTHRPIARLDEADFIFKTQRAKYASLANQIQDCYTSGQPVLVGTTSVEKNQIVSSLLKNRHIPHQLLNAKNHKEEAQVIANAGRLKAVTIATNMAGRGVDINLGGAKPIKDNKKVYQKWQQERDEVIRLGGLKVLGTERHESRRIDNQLRGRSGRQGEPGSSRFYVALDDDLMRIFGGEQISALMTRFKMPENEAITHSMVSRALEQIQVKVEGFNFDSRKAVVEYDDVLNKQRDLVYTLRNTILNQAQKDPDSLTKETFKRLKNQIQKIISTATSFDTQKVNWDQVVLEFNEILPFISQDRRLLKTKLEKSADPQAELEQILTKAWDQRLETFPEGVGTQILKELSVLTLDNLWVDHLSALDSLRSGVRLRGYAQKDPLVEYRKEGFEMFQTLMSTFEYNLARRIFRVQVQAVPKAPPPKDLSEGRGESVKETVSTSDQPSDRPSGHKSIPKKTTKTPGRNDPCPCGSGKKYKKCHYPQYG